jgi:hypothetical protein
MLISRLLIAESDTMIARQGLHVQVCRQCEGQGRLLKFAEIVPCRHWTGPAGRELQDNLYEKKLVTVKM